MVTVKPLLDYLLYIIKYTSFLGNCHPQSHIAINQPLIPSNRPFVDFNFPPPNLFFDPVPSCHARHQHNGSSGNAPPIPRPKPPAPPSNPPTELFSPPLPPPPHMSLARCPPIVQSAVPASPMPVPQAPRQSPVPSGLPSLFPSVVPSQSESHPLPPVPYQPGPVEPSSVPAPPGISLSLPHPQSYNPYTNF